MPMPVVTVTPEMISYSHTRYALYFISYAYAALVVWGSLASGAAARMRDWAQRFKNRFLQFICFYLLYLIATFLLVLPLRFYSGYWLEHAYHLSDQSLGGWIGDLLKGIGVSTLIAIPGWYLLLATVRRFPRTWSWWVWIAGSVLIAVGIFLEPLVIDPIFNKYTPMPAGELRTKIESLAASAGIPGAPIYVVDSSKQTNKLNAFVNGFGTSHRIVIWDNLINKLPQDQVLSVVGHEIGHYVLHHIYWGFALAVGGLLVLLALLQRFAEPLRAKLPARWGVRSLDDFTMVPVVLLGAMALSFLGSPVDSAISRYMEHQADAFGLQLTGNREAMAQSFVSLSEKNLSEPDPPKFIEFWIFTHPSLKERIDFALGKSAG